MSCFAAKHFINEIIIIKHSAPTWMILQDQDDSLSRSLSESRIRLGVCCNYDDHDVCCNYDDHDEVQPREGGAANMLEMVLTFCMYEFDKGVG